MKRIMIAAPKSGSGKTLLTCGLLNILKEREPKCTVVSFKCGPDFIDPMFHRRVIGVKAENLDSFFSNRDELVSIMRNSQGELAVLEGVMGIYDGIGQGSCYEIAEMTETPILLVMDCSGIWNTILALIKGLVMEDHARLIKGIIFNKVGQSYFDTIAPMVDKMLMAMNHPARAMGFIPKVESLRLESRHLGLKLPSEIQDLQETIDKVSGLITQNCNLPEILKIMEEASSIKEELIRGEEDRSLASDGIEIVPDLPLPGKLRLAVARDEAFCFYYEENLRALRERGIQIVEFSPIHDALLPEDICGILIGGGYPELYLKELQNNESMRGQLKQAILSGMPFLAECGGFMYLMETIEEDASTEGKEDSGEYIPAYKMVGGIPGGAFNTGKLSRFGYITITTEKDGLLSPGETIKGHEFHYYDTTNNGEDCVARKQHGNKSWNCVHQNSWSFLGYPHLYYRSNPKFVERFKTAMEKYRKDSL